MSDSKKLVMGDSYRDALIRKGTDSFRQEARALARKTATEKKMASKKEQAIISRHQKLIDQKLQEVKYYEAKLKAAEKRHKDGAYDLFGKITLGLFVLVILSGIILLLSDFDSNIPFVLVIIAFISLMISLLAQASVQGEISQISVYSFKLKTARKELLKLTTPPQN